MMLPSDIALLEDEKLSEYVRMYAEDQVGRISGPVG
jgi:hypothetical protein